MNKRKIDAENRNFSDSWRDKYCFVSDKGVITCLICSRTVSVPKEYNVRRHYETHHSTFSKLQGEERKRKIEFLERSLTAQRSVFTKQSSQLDACVEVSLEVASLIAKSGRPFTDGDFAKQCILLSAEKLCPEMQSKFQQISLNRMTVQRRITQLDEDLVGQLQLAASKFRFFSLAADESTDITSTAQLLVFVRGISENFEITEELLGMSSMKGQTTGADLLSSILDLCSKFSLDMKKLVSVTTDGAPAMVGTRNGMVNLLKLHLGTRDIELINYHCIIHQEQLCAKELGYEKLMKTVSDSINFIRSHGLNHRQFKKMLEDIDSNHHDLVYYTEVRWLSRGEALSRFADLLEDVILFMKTKDKPTRLLQEPRFQCDLAFLVDITGHLNELNKKFMGKKSIHLPNDQ